MAFLRARPAALGALVGHVDTASVAEVVARLLGADDAMGLPARELAWLRESGVLRALLEQLNPEGAADASSSSSSSSPSSPSPPSSPLSPSSSPSLVADAQRHAAAVLAAVVRAHGSPLLSAFAERDFIDALLARAFAKGAPSVQALEVAVALLEPKEPPSDPYFLSPAAAAAAAEVDIATKDAAVAGVVARLGDLVSLLDAPPATPARRKESESGGEAGGEGEGEGQRAGEGAAAAAAAAAAAPAAPSSSPGAGTAATIQLTPYGVLAPPLGLTRIKAVALLVALLRSGRADAVAGVVASGAVARCLDLFVAYPFNNLLHHHVAALLLTALDGVGHDEEEEEEGEEDEAGGDRGAEAGGGGGGARGDTKRKGQRQRPPSGPAVLLAHVLRDVNLPKWLASAPAEVRPTPLPGDARAAAGLRRPLRAGYLGHVTHLGNRLLALEASGNAAIADALGREPAWRPWAEGDLAERTRRDDPDGWECGRPAPPPAFGGGLMGADSLGAEGDAYDGWGAPVGSNNDRRGGAGGIGGLVGASAGDSSDEDGESEEDDGDSDGDSDDSDGDGGGDGGGDGKDEDEVVRAGGGIRVPRRRGGGAAGGSGGSGSGGAGALDLQELAEAAASVGALRISGGDISAAAAAAAAAAAENGSPTLSSSDDDDGDADGEEEDEDPSASSSSSSLDSDAPEEADAVPAAAALAAAAAAPASAAPDAALDAAAASSEAASPDWAAFPEIEGEGGGGEKKGANGDGKRNKKGKGGK